MPVDTGNVELMSKVSFSLFNQELVKVPVNSGSFIDDLCRYFITAYNDDSHQLGEDLEAPSGSNAPTTETCYYKKTDILRAISAILFENGTSVKDVGISYRRADGEKSTTLNDLFQIISESSRNSGQNDQMEQRRMALNCMANLVHKTGTLLSALHERMYEIVLSNLAVIPQYYEVHPGSTNGARRRGRGSERKLISSALRALHFLLQEDKNISVRSIPSLMNVVCKYMFFTSENWANQQSPTSPSSTLSVGVIQRLSYSVPSNIMSRSKSNSISSATPHILDHSESLLASSRGIQSSDSEYSDTESGVHQVQNRQHDGKVRLNALLCLQALARGASKQLQPHWSKFLTTSSAAPMIAGSHKAPSLIGLIGFEPLSNVRSAACVVLGNILDNSKQYLAMAEENTNSSGTKNQTGLFALSERIGLMTRELHMGFVSAMNNVDISFDQGVVIQMIKCGSTIVANCSYEKMRNGLPVLVFRSVEKFLDSNDPNLQSAVLLFLTSLFGNATACTEIRESILSPPINSSPANPDVISRLLDLIAVQEVPSATSIEAWNTLRAIVQFHFDILAGLWPKLDMILGNVQKTQDSRVRSASLLFLEEYSKAGTSANTLRVKHTNNTLLFEEENPSIKSTACDCISHISSDAFGGLPSRLEKLIIPLMLGTALDEHPAVRAAACRAIGVFILLPSLWEDSANLVEMASTVLELCQDSNLNVRVRASWAVGNLCDSLVLLKNNNQEDILGEILTLPLWTKIMKTALQISQDHEKIKSNGIRAIGGLLRVTFEGILERERNSLVKDAVYTLIKHMEQGSLKGRWNACYAMQNVLLNPNFPIGSTAGSSYAMESDMVYWTKDVYGALLQAIQYSKNFKVRINACSAIAAVKTMAKYGDHVMLQRIVQVLITAVQHLDGEQGEHEFSEFQYRGQLETKLLRCLDHILQVTGGPGGLVLDVSSSLRERIISSRPDIPISIGIPIESDHISAQLVPSSKAPTATHNAITTTTATLSSTSTPTPLSCVPEYNCATSPKGCLNNGQCNSGKCKCLAGFGGSDCGQLACGSPLKDPLLRPTVPINGTCATCDDGYSGINCNVCQNDNACTAASPRKSFFDDEKMVCNKKPNVFLNTYMNCAVRAPELLSLFPGTYTASINMDVTNKTLRAQVWRGQEEQVFCSATECAVKSKYVDGKIQSAWDCPNISCGCIMPSTICGGLPDSFLELEDLVKTLGGSLAITCTEGSTDCTLLLSEIVALFPDGITISDCDMGECVFPSEMISTVIAPEKSSLSTGVIVCLAILGAILIALITICAIARKNQLTLRQAPYTFCTEAASLEFRNIGYILNKSGLEILKGVSGSAPAGEVLAVMGPSGSGKSTLVDILAGKHKDGKVTGRLLLNGKPVHVNELRGMVGFVDQEDTLPSTQTVYEAILFSAMLRLPEAMPLERVHERVDEIIDILGLTHCANRRIGDVTARGISGGEKRRVSIALEMITRPPILILDEPTSGLDSYSANMVIDQLCKLAASKTTTIILTIHQPRSDFFYKFNQALVISKGEEIYFGLTSSAADYFRQRDLTCPMNYNIADHLLDIAMNDELAAISRNYRGEKCDMSTGHQPHISGNLVSRHGASSNENIDGTSEVTHDSSGVSNGSKSYETSVKISGGKGLLESLDLESEDIGKSAKNGKVQKINYPTSFLTQLSVIMKRNSQTLVRDKSLLILHLGVSFILALFIGGLYFQIPVTLAGFQNRVGSVFFMLALLGFSSISALGAFSETRTLFIKERSNGYYPPLPFIIATLLFDLIPLRVVPSLILGCISYYMIGFSPVVITFLKFLLILVIFNVSTGMFCLVVASSVKSAGVASLVSSISMLFMMLFGGFMINSTKIPAALTWIQYLSMYKYGFEALAVNEIATAHLVDSIQGISFDIPGSLILQKLFGFDLDGYWRCVVVLIGFIAFFITIFWFLVVKVLRERK
ncbi:hypothetical protein BGZ76_011422 [Entomortierella beljakovae]|nr:hypothetical protein BGZ76_011422 [Entomortierella beljakovae]